MLSLKQTQFKSTAEFIKAINELLSFYGFESLDTLPKANSRVAKTQAKRGAKRELQILNMFERKAASLCKELVNKYGVASIENSTQLYAHDDLSKSRKLSCNYTLHNIAQPDSFSEALLVYAADTIIKKFFTGSNIYVELNSLGDKDSVAKYMIDMRKFLRRNKKRLAESYVVELQNEDISKLLVKLHQAKHPILEDAPSLMDYLSDVAQKHLYSFLDYLDHMNISYGINPYLFGSSDIWRHIIMNVYLQDKDGNLQLIAQGGRYDNAAQNLFGLDLSLSSLVFYIEHKGRKTKITAPAKAKPKKPKVYFMQLGLLAKTQGAKLLQEMQENKIDVEHSFAELSLLEQYKLAHDAGAKYAIILGHKEAIDKVVIVRNLDTQSQKVLKQDELIKHLKKLK